MSLTLSRRIKAVLRNGMDTVWAHQVVILAKWEELLTQLHHGQEKMAPELDMSIRFFSERLFLERDDVEDLFEELRESWRQMPLHPQPNHIIFIITLLENAVHEAIKPEVSDSYRKHQAVQFLFSKMSEELLPAPLNRQLDMNTFIEQLVSSKQLPIHWVARLVKDGHEFRVEKVFNQSNQLLENATNEGLRGDTLFSLSESLLEKLSLESESNQRILPIPWEEDTLLFCTNERESDVLPFVTFALQLFRTGENAVEFYKQELNWKDAVILFNEWIMRSLTLNEALENITSGFVNYLPFERCALFSYSNTEESGFGLFGYHLNNKAIQNIKEDIHNIPLIQTVLQQVQFIGGHAKNLQPILISEAAKGLPTQYVQQFQLESIVIAPIYAPSEGKLIGAAILDQGPSTRFKVSRETMAALMKFGQSAGEILTKFGSDHQESKATVSTHLSPREIEVLKLMAEGASTNEAAQELHLSEYTVRDYISAILQKMQARNRTEAVVKAIRDGLI